MPSEEGGLRQHRPSHVANLAGGTSYGMEWKNHEETSCLLPFRMAHYNQFLFLKARFLLCWLSGYPCQMLQMLNLKPTNPSHLSRLRENYAHNTKLDLSPYIFKSTSQRQYSTSIGQKIFPTSHPPRHGLFPPCSPTTGEILHNPFHHHLPSQRRNVQPKHGRCLKSSQLLRLGGLRRCRHGAIAQQPHLRQETWINRGGF